MIDNFMRAINEDVAIEGYQKAVAEAIENGLIRDMYFGILGEAFDTPQFDGEMMESGFDALMDDDSMFNDIQEAVDPHVRDARILPSSNNDRIDYAYKTTAHDLANTPKMVMRAKVYKQATGDGMYDVHRRAENAANDTGSVLWKNRQKMYESDAALDAFLDPLYEGKDCCGNECLDCNCNMTNAARPDNGGGVISKTITMLPGSDPRSVGSYFSNMDAISVDGSVKESDVSYLIDMIPETTFGPEPK
jgi:hypothetical protein